MFEYFSNSHHLKKQDSGIKPSTSSVIVTNKPDNQASVKCPEGTDKRSKNDTNAANIKASMNMEGDRVHRFAVDSKELFGEGYTGDRATVVDKYTLEKLGLNPCHVSQVGYVPLSVAESCIKQVDRVVLNNMEIYRQKTEVQREEYNKNIIKVKDHYEKVIKDMKNMSDQYISKQKLLRSKLLNDIQTQQELSNELRQQIESKDRQHDEEICKMKSYIRQLESTTSDIRNFSMSVYRYVYDYTLSNPTSLTQWRSSTSGNSQYKDDENYDCRFAIESILRAVEVRLSLDEDLSSFSTGAKTETKSFNPIINEAYPMNELVTFEKANMTEYGVWNHLDDRSNLNVYHCCNIINDIIDLIELQEDCNHKKASTPMVHQQLCAATAISSEGDTRQERMVSYEIALIVNDMINSIDKRGKMISTGTSPCIVALEDCNNIDKRIFYDISCVMNDLLNDIVLFDQTSKTNESSRDKLLDPEMINSKIDAIEVKNEHVVLRLNSYSDSFRLRYYETSCTVNGIINTIETKHSLNQNNNSEQKEVYDNLMTAESHGELLIDSEVALEQGYDSEIIPQTVDIMTMLLGEKDRAIVANIITEICQRIEIRNLENVEGNIWDNICDKTRAINLLEIILTTIQVQSVNGTDREESLVNIEKDVNSVIDIIRGRNPQPMRTMLTMDEHYVDSKDCPQDTKEDSKHTQSINEDSSTLPTSKTQIRDSEQESFGNKYEALCMRLEEYRMRWYGGELTLLNNQETISHLQSVVNQRLSVKLIDKETQSVDEASAVEIKDETDRHRIGESPKLSDDLLKREGMGFPDVLQESLNDMANTVTALISLDVSEADGQSSKEDLSLADPSRQSPLHKQEKAPEWGGDPSDTEFIKSTMAGQVLVAVEEIELMKMRWEDLYARNIIVNATLDETKSNLKRLETLKRHLSRPLLLSRQSKSNINDSPRETTNDKTVDKPDTDVKAVNGCNLETEAGTAAAEAKVEQISEGKGAVDGDTKDVSTDSSDMDHLPLHNPDDIAVIEQLEDHICELNESLSQISQDNHKLIEEKAFLQHQYDNIVKEKRTDVIQRLDSEVLKLNQQVINQSLDLSSCKTEKVKLEKRIEELTSRVQIAEKELKDRDAMELAKLNDKEEKQLLKTQIGKQRDELVMKSKAATAGWDAAANADEKLEKDVEKAYYKGYNEGRYQNTHDIQALHQAIELKENRLTELVLQINELEGKVRLAEIQSEQYRNDLNLAKQETADTVLLFNQIRENLRPATTSDLNDRIAPGPQRAVDAIMSEDTAIDSQSHRSSNELLPQDKKLILAPSSQEYESLKGLLDQSQEEVVELHDKMEHFYEKIKLYEQKMTLYDQMLSLERQRFNRVSKVSHIHLNTSPAKSVSHMHSSPMRQDVDQSHFDVISYIKTSQTKGNMLIKNNKKDECYELYIQMMESVLKRLGSNQEYKKLFVDSMTTARNIVTTPPRPGQKAKALPILKKAIDKLLLINEAKAMSSGVVDAQIVDNLDVDSMQEIPMHDTEDIDLEIHEKELQLSLITSFLNGSTNSKTSNGLDSTAETGITAEAEAEARPDGKISAISPTLCQSDSATSNAMTQSHRQKEDLSEDVKTESASSLLKRAKEAEKTIENMKRQMILLVSMQQNIDQDPQQEINTDNMSKDQGNGNLPHSENKTVGPSHQMLPFEKEKSSKPMISSKPIPINPQSSIESIEFRRLQRRVKDLENQLKSQEAKHFDPSGLTSEKKSNELYDKQTQKKLKEQERIWKKEKSQYESRIFQLEKLHESLESRIEPMTKERDILRQKTKDLMHMNEEIGILRNKVSLFDAISQQLEEKSQQFQQISEQLKRESSLRKKYKNDLEDMKGSIRVFARCRPMNSYELSTNCKSQVTFRDDSSLLLQTSRGDKPFEFDSVFHTETSQELIFDDAKRLVESCMDGFNVCIFAYGQTGSGKTFTMTGTPEMPGLTPRSVYELFSLMREKPSYQFKISSYFVELYNDNLVDLYWLLDNRIGARTTDGVIIEPPKLEIKLDAKKMVTITNVTTKEVASPEELMMLYECGNTERHTGATKMNATSSRSHSIFAILIESFDTVTKRTITGKLSLVDLAGSERADKTGATGNTLKEAQSINKSLSALGNVVAALSEGEKYIPYRSNKLTMLMQDSLGGNAKTLMFVNFSPADYNAEETYSSLNYAARVKKIVNNVQKQSESAEISRLKGIIKKLQSGADVSKEEVMGMDSEPPEIVSEDVQDHGNDEEGEGENPDTSS